MFIDAATGVEVRSIILFGVTIMRAILEDWKNGWCGVELGLLKEDIDPLIELLKMLKQDPDQHFHLTSDYKGPGGLGDLTICIQGDDEQSNMESMGKALSPGEEIK
jgi:hypothetical protein